MDRIRARLTYANVMVTVLAFIVLTGGGAVALGNAGASQSEALSSSAAAGPWHVIGATGQPKFGRYGECRWENYDSVHSNAAYVRDPSGFVHIKGTVIQTLTRSGACDPDSFKVIFILPPGYRPARREATASIRGDPYDPAHPPAELAVVIVDGPSIASLPAGAVSVAPNMASDELYFSLDSISFRCAPSGHNGCP